MGASFSCYYELQSRVELFRLFRVCCEAISGPCKAPPPFSVSMPGLKSDRREFTSTVRSLQCTISPIQKVDSLFLAESALPRFFEILNQCPGLLNKRKFSVWHLLSSSYFQKIGIRSSLETFTRKVSPERRRFGCQLPIKPTLPQVGVQVQIVSLERLLLRSKLQLLKRVLHFDHLLKSLCSLLQLFLSWEAKERRKMLHQQGLVFEGVDLLFSNCFNYRHFFEFWTFWFLHLLGFFMKLDARS